MVSIDNLIEQTAFLAEKQSEAQKECGKIFDDLLAAIQNKIAKNKDNPEEAASLEHVYSLMSEQAEKLSEEAQVDVDFLTEQLVALTKIKEVKDPVKAQELLSMLIDEDEEIKEIESFKKEITDEAEISKQNLMTLVNDIKLAIQEGSAQDVELYLESLLKDSDLDEDEDDEDAEDFFADDEEDACADCDGCSSDQGGCCNDKEEEDACCGSSKGTNIFAGFTKDQDKKTTH